MTEFLKQIPICESYLNTLETHLVICNKGFTYNRHQFLFKLLFTMTVMWLSRSSCNVMMRKTHYNYFYYKYELRSLSPITARHRDYIYYVYYCIYKNHWKNHKNKTDDTLFLKNDTYNVLCFILMCFMY